MKIRERSDELFVKSFGWYSFSVVVLWLMKKYEYSEFLETLHPVLMFILGVPTVVPVAGGIVFGGIGSVISFLILMMNYFVSLDPDSESVKWYFQIVSFVSTFVFGWLLYHFSETSGFLGF